MNNNIFPVITLYQPWATWIMRRWKKIETRTHARFACLKGKRILIHAGQKTDGSELTVKNPYLRLNQIIHNPDEVINGYLLGTALVYDFGKLNGRHSNDALIDCQNTDRWGLYLSDVLKFKHPILAKGEMGIWYFDLKGGQKSKKPTIQLDIFEKSNH